MILAVTWAEIFAIAGKKPEKKIRLRRDSNLVPLNTSWTPLPTDRRNHALGGREGGREVLGIAQTMVVLQLLT